MKSHLPLLTFCLLLGTCLAGVGRGEEASPAKAKPNANWKREIKVFPLFHADYEDVKVVASEFLSEQGKLSYLRRKNSVVVIDYPANIAQIKKVVDALEGDDPPVNIRIKVAFAETGEGGGSGWEVDPGWPVTIEDGKVKNKRIDVYANKGKTATSSQTVQEILTMDGREAQLWVGETVKEPMWVYEYGRRHHWWQADWVEYDFGASLWVKPVLLNNGTIEIDVYPRITSRTKQRLSVDVKELTVSILARPGQTVTIGGMDTAKRTAYSKILGRGKIFNGNSLNITLTPYIEKMDRPPPPGTPRNPVTPIKVDRTYKHLPRK